FFVIHSESALGIDASAVSTSEADPVKSAPSNFVPQQQGINEGTKNTSYDQLFAGTGPHVLADKPQSISEGLETVLTQPTTGKGASSIARQVEEDEASRTIKLEDLAKLVSSVQPGFKDLDLPEDDPIVVVDGNDEDEEAYKVHATTNVETEDTSVPKYLSPRSSKIQELTNQVLILQSQKHKLELEKNKVKAALLKAQPSFPNVGHLNGLLVKSLQTEFSKILSAHDFSSSLPPELKELPSMFNELIEEVKGLKKQVHELEIKLSGYLKEIPSKLDDFTKIVTSLTSQVAELKTLQWELPTEFLSVPTQVKKVQAKLKTLDAVPSLLKKFTNALNQFAKAIASKKTKDTETEKESTSSDSDDETHLTGSMVEPSKAKKIKKFDFVTEGGKYIHLTKEEINHQKKIKEEAKVKVAKRESEV
ncbi:hypothetical protein Tco_1021997, partial [Tanacetum coccineum]